MKQDVKFSLSGTGKECSVLDEFPRVAFPLLGQAKEENDPLPHYLFPSLKKKKKTVQVGCIIPVLTTCIELVKTESTKWARTLRPRTERRWRGKFGGRGC